MYKHICPTPCFAIYFQSERARNIDIKVKAKKPKKILSNMKVHRGFRKNPPSYPNINQIEPSTKPHTLFSKIQFNIIL